MTKAVRRSRTWPTIALLITLALTVAGIGSHVLQNYQSGSITKNEAGVLAILRNLSSSQAMFQANTLRDRNGNEIGEFGDFHEMSRCDPPVVSAKLGRGSATRVKISGYYIEIHVPDDPDDREKEWCAYAWPIRYGHTGKRVFMISQLGDVLFSANTKRYSGEQSIPEVDAAFQEADRSRIESLAVNTEGNDGETWTLG